MTNQRQLSLCVSSLAKLVTVETAKVVLGVDGLTIDAQIDEGKLMAFNVSPTGARNREIRIWVSSLPGETHKPKATAIEAIDDVAGYQLEIRSGELQSRLCIDDNTVYRLIDSGQLKADRRRIGKLSVIWVNTQSLRDFLRSRVLGAV